MDIKVGDIVYILTGYDVTTGFFTQIMEDKVIDLIEGKDGKEMVFCHFGLNQPTSRLGIDIFKNIADAEKSDLYAFCA